MPRRMIDSGIWRNDKFGNLPDAGRLLFIGMFSNADDDGRLKASPRFLKAIIFPYDNDKTADQVQELRDQCAKLGLIRLYSKNGQEYLDLPGWKEHQRIRKDRYTPSKLPEYNNADTKMTTNWQPDDNQVSTTGVHRGGEDSLVKVNTPPKGGARKKRANSQTDPRVKEIFNEIHQFFGYPDKVQQDPIPNYAKEGQFIKKMLNRGFTCVEILACWRSKVSQRGGDYVSMVWVNEDIGKKGRTVGADKRHTEPSELEKWDPSKPLRSATGSLGDWSPDKPLRPATGNLGDWTPDKSLR
jgi:hypothetical protein